MTRIVIVSHYARRDRAERLATSLNANLIIDEVGLGALWGHRKALEWCAQQNERCVIMEDDALPVTGFEAKAAHWLERFPDDLVSFYLGTGRPHYVQGQIAYKLRRADQWRQDHIGLSELIHGVCYSVPVDQVSSILAALNDRLPADFAIGNAWRDLTNRRPIIYPVKSLVDHDDIPSVEAHPDGQKRTEPRRAWRLDQ